jgi:hypothetical protein
MAAMKPKTLKFGFIDRHSSHGKVEFVSNEKSNLAQEE